MNDISARFPRGLVKTNSFRGIFAAVALLASAMSPAYSADYYNIPAATLAESTGASSISGSGSSTGWSTTKGGSRAIAGITAADSVYHVYSDFACRSYTSSYATPASSSIEVEAGVSWMIFGKQSGGTTTLNNLHLAENSTLHYYNLGDGGIGALAGNFTMAEGACLQLSGRYYSNARSMNLSATVSGSGSIEFFRYDGNNTYYANQIVHSVTGDISAFTGDLVVYDYNDISTLVLELSNASSLPGDPDAGAIAKVVVTNGATLRICQDWTSPGNRSWDFGDGNKPTVYVASGKTVTINGAVIGSKGFTKTGEGKLVLAGCVIGFTEDDITVSEGELEFSVDNSLLITSSIDDVASFPDPTYGVRNGISAEASFLVSCGTTPATNADGSIQYACKGWKLYDLDGNQVSSGSDTSFTYTHPDPAASRKLEWQWEATSVRGTIAAAEGGTVSPSGTAWYSMSGSVTVTATPEEGGLFTCWAGTLPDGIDATSASVTFTPTAPFAMTAIFLPEFYVSPGGSDDNLGTSEAPFATIAHAIEQADAAIVSDGVDSVTIHVADGTYTEYALTLAHPITVEGNSSDRTAVKIGASVAGQSVFIMSAAGATLRNLTVQNGYGTSQNGGNIRMTADGVVSNCVVTSGTCNNGGGKGGNVYMSAGLVVDSVITSGYRNGGGTCQAVNLYMTGGRVSRCRVLNGNNPVNSARNTSAAVMINGGVVENSFFSRNTCTQCPVIRLAGSSRLVNCSVIGNTTGSDYGAVFLADANPSVVNCVIFDNGNTAVREWGNSQGGRFINCASTVANDFGSGWVTLENTDWTAYFADNSDYIPLSDTPLMDAGSNDGYSSYATTSIDLAGTTRVSPSNGTVDIGCYEVDQSQLSISGAIESYQSVLVGATVDFSGAAVGATGTVTYEWNFGDGSDNLVTTEASFTRQFDAPGLFSVKVRGKDGNGAYGSWFEILHPIRVSKADLYVSTEGDDSNPGTSDSPFLTVAAALNSLTNLTSSGATAVDGVTVHLADGVYSECNLPDLASAVTVTGNQSDRSAVKVGKNSGRVFRMSGSGAKLEHLTVQNGKVSNGNGSNVLMTGAGTISDCVVTGGALATNGYLGGNLYATAGTVEDCEFVYGYGNGINTCLGASIYAAGARISRCIVRSCAYTYGPSGGAAIQLASGAVMENCLVVSNTSTYAVLSAADSKIVNCSIVGNTPKTRTFNAVSGKIYNSVIYGNGGTAATEWYQNAANFVNCAFSAAAAYSGTASTVTNLTDAAFKDYANGDYRPAKGTEAAVLVNAGSSWADYTGYGAASTTDLAGDPRLRGSRLDIGCYEAATGIGLLLIVR